MNPQIVLLPTFDYEPFHGRAYDTDEAILFEPTARMLAIAKSKGIPFTLFADICSAWAHRDNGLHVFADRFESQLCDAVADGHDVQLHVHAHWNNSIYRDGEWQLCETKITLPELGYEGGEPERILHDGIAYLEKMLVPLRADYRCIAFRAGGLALQPDERKLIALLGKAGIQVDSSIAKGLMMRADTVAIDYLRTPDEGNWWISAGSGIESADSKEIFEVPIISFTMPWNQRIKFLVRRAMSYRSQRGAGMSRSARQTPTSQTIALVRENLRYLSSNPVFLFSADTKGFDRRMLCDGFHDWVRYHAREGAPTLYVSMINHPKLMRPQEERLLFDVLDEIAETYGESLRFSTFQQLAQEVIPKVYELPRVHKNKPSREIRRINVRPRLAVVTSRFPFGPLEAFLNDEIEEFAKTFAVTIFPAVPDNAPLSAITMKPLVAPKMKMLSPRVLFHASQEFLRNPVKIVRLFHNVVTAPRDFGAKVRNAAIFPKALAVAREARKRNIEHIHAYWLSAPATIAYVVSELNGITWSATGHRYDLVNYNMSSVGTPNAGFLPHAEFIRTISERGRRQVLLASGNGNVHTVHLGVRLPYLDRNGKTPHAPIRLICVANFDRVKGHEVLFEALRLLKPVGTPVTCTLAGAGPEQARLEQLAGELGIRDIVKFEGSVPRGELLRRLEKGMYDIAILTSVDEGWHRCEGIPVCLMEAMAAGLPCIATNSGSVNELVDTSNGILLAPGDAPGIAGAIGALASDNALYARLSLAARATVARSFSVTETSQELMMLLFPEKQPAFDLPQNVHRVERSVSL